jgi:hypothetical protein
MTLPFLSAGCGYPGDIFFRRSQAERSPVRSVYISRVRQLGDDHFAPTQIHFYQDGKNGRDQH